MEYDDILINILSQYGTQIIDDYRRKLYEGGSVASGELGNSLSTEVVTTNGVYEVTLRIEEYWKYVEYGRLPGKFPNIDAIKKGISIKPVIPTILHNGKLPTTEQLTYLISRKIAREGIEPKYYLNNVINELDLTPLEDAVTRLIENNLDQSLRQL